MRTGSVFLFFVFLLPLIICRDAIQYFVAHRKVKYVMSEELINIENCSTRWIEYRYVFENTDLSDMSNRSLKIGVYHSEWVKYDSVDCRMLNDDHEQTLVEGYDVDIIEHLQELQGISTEFIFIDNLTKLVTNEVDLVICQPHSEFLPVNVTELHPTLRSNLLLVFKATKLNFNKDIFILTFAGSLWVVFFSIMILLAVCLRISIQKYAKMKSNYESWTWVEITLWAIAAACQQGLSRTPSGFASCVIFFLGYLMAYLLYTGFAAAITSILVQNVGTNADLNNVNIETLHLVSPECTRSYVKQFQGRFLVTEYVSDLNELFEQLDKHNRIGVGPEISIQQYMVNNFNSDELSEFQTMKLDITYTKGFLTLRNNPWRKIVDKHIVALDESGILQNKLKRHLRPTSNFNQNSSYSSASQEHVGSAVVLFLGGIAISLVFFVAELVLYLYKKGQRHNRKKNKN